MKPLVAIFLLLALLFPAGMGGQVLDTAASNIDDELGSVVPLLLILATPEKYENHKVMFSAFVKRYEWGYVGFYNEDSAKYDLLEYGVLLQTNSAVPLTNFNAAIEKNGTSECYYGRGVLQTERKERKLDKGRVLMPVMQLIGFGPIGKGKRLSVIPNSAVEGTLIPAVSLLLQPEKYLQKKIVTRGILLDGPEGNVLLHATADYQFTINDHHYLYVRYGYPHPPGIFPNLQISMIEGIIHETHFGFPFPPVPEIEVTRYW